MAVEQKTFNVGIMELEDFIEKSKFSKLNKVFFIEKISTISKLFFYLGLIGSILTVLALFGIIFWSITWIYTFFLIIFMGFVFAKPHQRYNFILVLAILFVLMFIPTSYCQSLLVLTIGDEGDADPAAVLAILEVRITGLEELLSPYLIEEYTMADVRECIEGGGVWNYAKYFGIQLDIAENPFHDYLADYITYVNSASRLKPASITTIIPIDGFIDAITKLSENPFGDSDNFGENVATLITNLIDVLNWIVFLAIIAYGGSAVADGFKLDFGQVAKKIAFIAMAIAIMTFIYALFGTVATQPIRTVWETIGSAWDSLLGGLGLGMLDAQGVSLVNGYSAVNGVYKLLPIIFTVGMFGLAIGFRKSDFKSILFSKTVLEEDVILVKRARFSIPIAVLLLAMAIYVVGYFLVTAEPTVTINPLITIVFYLFSIVVLFLIGFNFLILNTEKNYKSFIKKLLMWTLYGLLGLFTWFQIIQPVCYSLGWMDTPSGLITLSQGASVFESDVLEQLFLVAMPETLIFQIFFVGLGNRLYFYFRKTRLIEKETKRLQREKEKLTIQLEGIKVTESTDKANLRKIARMVVVQRKINTIDKKVNDGNITKVSPAFFVISTVISGLIGSFFFSWYHSFRRGVSFQFWWQNPLFGLVYMGAGFFLCLVSFFSFPASILVHGLNNIIAIFLMGG